jgi:hypothetical protein
MPNNAIVTLKIQKWDTEDEKPKLPKNMKVEIEYDRDWTVEDFHDEAMDEASDSVGWAIDTCTIENIKFL